MTEGGSVLDDRIQCRYAGFFLLEVAVRVEEVVDRGDEEGVVVASGEVSGEGSQIADVALGVAYDQDSEHLAVLEFVVPFRTGLEVGLYLFGGPYTEGVGRVVEGVGELFRKRDVANVVLECMHGCFAQMDKKCAIIGA